MIHVTRLNGEKLTLNADLIEFIESIPDTMISLTTGRKVMVRESVDEVVERAIAYECAIRTGARLHQRRGAPVDTLTVATSEEE